MTAVTPGCCLVRTTRGSFGAANGIDALTRDYGVVCHTA